MSKDVAVVAVVAAADLRHRRTEPLRLTKTRRPISSAFSVSVSISVYS